jgi:hypothetical protein
MAHIKPMGDNVALGNFFVGRTLVRQLLPAINPMCQKLSAARIIFSIGINAEGG